MEDELYLENIDEFVTDQNRVVTYKWLSYTLGVHVNQAKQMLYDYVERKRKENAGAQLHVTYLVAGNLIQNGHICHKVAVVKEDKLEAIKSKLSTVASIHVYSIQKAILKDSSPLYSTDYDIIKANLQNCNKFSAIYCAAAVARTAAEMSQVEAPAPVESQPLCNTSAVTAPVVNGHGSSTSSKQTSQQTNGIMAMFAAKPVTKSQDKHKEAKLEVKETPNASTTTSKAPAKGNMLNNFFGKAALSTGKSRTEPGQQREEKAVAESPPSPPLESKTFSGASGLDKPRKKSEPAKVHLKGKKRVKKVDMSDEEEKEAENLKKKRYRIKQPESDSSDSEEVPKSPVIPEVKDSSPEPEPVLKPLPDPVPTEASLGGKKRKRKRVLKSKTFVDEEGCIVTEKAYESESCTDSEEEFRSKPPTAPRAPVAHNLPVRASKRESKEEKKGTKKAAAATSKASKQASITGFLQKK